MGETGDLDVRSIDLSAAPGQRESWDRSPLTVYLWSAAELLLVYNPWQPSSRLRAATLRAFGATVGESVILRPRLRHNLKVFQRSSALMPLHPRASSEHSELSVARRGCDRSIE